MIANLCAAGLLAGRLWEGPYIVVGNSFKVGVGGGCRLAVPVTGRTQQLFGCRNVHVNALVVRSVLAQQQALNALQVRKRRVHLLNLLLIPFREIRRILEIQGVARLGLVKNTHNEHDGNQ